MKPTTQARIDRVANLVSDHITPGRAAALRETVEFILKEQDRDTRHACAEAVCAVYTGERVMSKAEIVNAAHAACMNAYSV